MKKNRLWIVLLILIASFAAVTLVRQNTVPKNADAKQALYYCPMHPNYTSPQPGDCPICNMKLVKKETVTPKTFGDGKGLNVPRVMTVEELVNMKPGEICLLHKCKMGACLVAMTEEFARLGKCPHCGEDLGVIIKDIAPDGYGSVQLTPDKAQMIGVKTVYVGKKQMAKTIRTVGRIAYDPELYQAQEEYLQALDSQNKARSATIEELKEQSDKLTESAKLRLKLLGLSDALIERVAKSGKPDRSLLYAEPDGKVWLYAPIYEYEIPLIKIGDHVQAELPANAKKFDGVVEAIDPVIDPITRTVRIRAVLDNTEDQLKPEMYVNVTLQTNLGEVLAVPSEAIFRTGEQNIIFVAKGNGVFEPRQLTLGIRSEGFQEVKSGLAEGETVIVSGNFLIDSESRLKSALQEATSPGETHKHG